MSTRREPEVALVFTPEVWVEELHRHCTDHGGARVRAIVMDPTLALDEHFDVLVVSHRWPALTAGFVDAVHARGGLVLGVYEREEPAGRDHLMALDVDRVVESDAGPVGLVRAVTELVERTGGRSIPARPLDVAPARPADRGRGALVVVGGPGGTGTTEVAIGLAVAWSEVGRTALVDADEVAPSVGARLGLRIEPNLRSAVDAVAFADGRLDQAQQAVGRLDVLVGLPNASAWGQVRPGEVLDVVDRLLGTHERVVADSSASLEDLPVGTRGRYALTRALTAEADALVAVCAGTPVGIARFLQWAADARGCNAAAPLWVVVNRAPSDGFRRRELANEIAATLPVAGVHFVPADRRVEAAAWEGHVVGKGPFLRSVREIARAIAPSGAGRRVETVQP